MSITDILKKANELYEYNKEQLLPHFFFVGYMSLLAQYLQNGIFSFFVSLFLCSITHGYVKCAMKIVNEEKPVLEASDSLVGILEFPRVFPVYFIRKILIVAIVFLSILPTLLNFTYVTPLFSLEWILSTGNTLIQTDLFIPDISIIESLIQNMPLLINTILSAFLYFLLNCLFSFMPYILEEEEFSWLEAIIQSFKMMKGRMWMVISLYIAYLPRYLFYWLVTGVIAFILGSINEILMLMCLVISLFIYIGCIRGRVEIAKYLLYKEFMKGNLDE